jgi:hypothetical protein
MGETICCGTIVTYEVSSSYLEEPIKFDRFQVALHIAKELTKETPDRIFLKRVETVRILNDD